MCGGAGPADDEVRGDVSTGEAVASLGCSAVPNGAFHHVRLELGPKGQSCGDRANEYRVRVETSNCPDPRLQRRSLISCRIDAGEYSDEITTTDEVPQGGIELGIVAAGNHASALPGVARFHGWPSHRKKASKRGPMLRATPRILRIAPERKLPIRFHAQIRQWSLRSGAILRNLSISPGLEVPEGQVHPGADRA